MKKQIMSIAAAAALFTTGAMAFDATQGDGYLMKETGATSAIVGNYSNINGAIPATNAINKVGPGALGDALIYPAFFSGNNFSTEFSVINTSSTEAVIAKVVLYSAKDSKELRDFNIYLSSNDVFRATIKDGKITSTDGSTVVVGSDSLTNVRDHGFNYRDRATMATESTPFETTVDENIGYIAVFAMVQTDEDFKYGDYTDNVGYHKQHNALWRDYRHLLDQCRSENWRGGITNGIYTTGGVNQPNIELNATQISSDNTEIVVPRSGTTTCQHLGDTVLSTSTTGIKEVVFKNPDPVLTGTLTVIGNDAKGTRTLVVKPVAYDNFSDGNSTVLWTEGELASIADRCIDFTNNKANYNFACIERDVTAEKLTNTLYEFGSLESQLLVTQPWKRTVIQMHGDGNYTLSDAYSAWSGVGRQSTINGIVSGADGVDRNVKNYGGFSISQIVYNDDEDKYIGTSGGFTVSPASTANAGTIPNEMSMFDPLPGGANYEKGYSVINFGNDNMHGIVTQMTANEIDGTAELSWLYPLSNYPSN